MARLKSSSALLALGIAASACTGSGYGLSPHHNPTMTSVNQPVVQRTDYVFDVAAAERLTITRMEPGCPIWDATEVGARHTTSPNYGCAVNSNLAAMIADPNDLVLGQEGSLDGDAATASKAIKTYREKAPTGAGPLKAEKTDSN